MKHSQALKNLAIGAVNIVIFYFLIRWVVDNIRPDLLLEHLRRIPLAYVAPTVLVNILALMFYGLRLAVLVSRSFGVSFQIVNLGSGFNAILPFRLGEIARLYYARRIFSLSAAKLFAAGLIEKFFDLVALGGLVIVVLLFGSNGFVGKGVAAALFGLILAAYFSVVMFRSFSHHVEEWLSGLGRAQALIAALREYGKVHDLPQVSGYTLAIWVANVATVYVGFSGFLPAVEFGITDAIALLLIIALAIAIPSAPSGLGVFEAGIVAYLTQAFHIENELALACAIVFHMAMIIPQIVLTVLVLLRIRLPKTGVRAGG